MKDNPLEKVIEAKIGKYAKSKGCLYKKFVSPSNRSVPDRIIITPHGVVGFLELKRKGQQPNPQQRHELADLIQHGVIASRFDRAYLQARFPGYVILGARAGWFFPVHETKVVLVAGTWSGLTKAVFQHLSANKLVVPLDLSGEMADWWCREVDGSNCQAPVDPVAMARSVSLQSRAARFLRSFTSWVLSSSKFVDQAEAERRAALCAGCPKKGVIDCTGNCLFTRLLATAMKLLGGKATSRDSDLADCTVCGCVQKALVWVPLEHLQDPSLDDQWPEDYPCWHRPE